MNARRTQRRAFAYNTHPQKRTRKRGGRLFRQRTTSPRKTQPMKTRTKPNPSSRLAATNGVDGPKFFSVARLFLFIGKLEPAGGVCLPCVPPRVCVGLEPVRLCPCVLRHFDVFCVFLLCVLLSRRASQTTLVYGTCVVSKREDMAGCLSAGREPWGYPESPRRVHASPPPAESVWFLQQFGKKKRVQLGGGKPLKTVTYPCHATPRTYVGAESQAELICRVSCRCLLCCGEHCSHRLREFCTQQTNSGSRVWLFFVSGFLSTKKNY